MVDVRALLGTEKTEEDFNRSARFWFQAAVIFAALTFIVVICAGIAVINQIGTEDKQRAAQAFAPFLLAFMAGVTFCSAIWRGKISSEQTRQQQRQNNAKDEENLAKLLMDGTKLLSDEKESHVLAGIAALQAVASSENNKFSTTAMDILVDIIANTHTEEHKEFVYRAARGGVAAGARVGNKSTRSLEFDMEKLNTFVVPKIKGVRKITVRNGSISPLSYKFLTEIRFFDLQNVTVQRATIGREARHKRGCTFQRCKISSFSISFISSNKFISCDFSGADFTSNLPIGKFVKDDFISLKENGNFFNPEKPITSPRAVDWSEFLLFGSHRVHMEIEETSNETPA